MELTEDGIPIIDCRPVKRPHGGPTIQWEFFCPPLRCPPLGTRRRQIFRDRFGTLSAWGTPPFRDGLALLHDTALALKDARHRQKFLNRVGANSVYLTVCWIDRWPSQS